MIDKSLILIRIKRTDKYKIIKKLTNNEMFYYDLIDEKKSILIKINHKDLKQIKYFFGKKNVKIIKFFGFEGIINFFKRHYIFLLCVLWGYILLIILSNTIFEIEIISNDNNMIKIIMNELECNGIKKYKFKKSYKELNKIKNNILNENKDILEWIEIESFGTKYIVNFTPRIIPEEKNPDFKLQNITAKKDAIIMHIEADCGEIIKEVNDFVKKGDIIISGNIMRNEETLVSQVKASGKVYGEVWYTVNTTVPYKFIEYSPTGEIVNHIYINILGKKMTLTGRYETKYALIEKKVLVDKPYLFFKIINEKKEIYEYKEYILSNDEALKEAINRSIKSIEVKLNSEEYIIDKKVLKIDEYSSKINIEVFFKVYENITDTSVLEEIKEEKKE